MESDDAETEHAQLVFEMEDDSLLQSDLTSSLSLHQADVAIAEVMHSAHTREHERQQEEYTHAVLDDELLQWDDSDSDCSDVGSTFSYTQFLFSTSLPAASNLPSALSTSPLPSSLPIALSPAMTSTSIVSQWLRFHAFPASATQRLNGYTCSDLFALTKEDAKELLGVVEGIKLYHRIQSCKQRLAITRSHARRQGAFLTHSEHDSKYSAEHSNDSSLNSSAVSSPRLIPPPAFAAALRRRASAARLQCLAAVSGTRCGVVGCGCGVVEARRWLGVLCGVWVFVVQCARL